MTSARRSSRPLPLDPPHTEDAPSRKPLKMLTHLRLARGTRVQVGKICLDKGLGLRGKSAWINDAIQEFLRLPDWMVYTRPLVHASTPGKSEQITLDAEIWMRLWEAAVAISRAYLDDVNEPETIPPDISIIARSAIAWKVGMMEESQM